MPVTWLGAKTCLSSVAPVAMTISGATSGAVLGRVLINWFEKAACAAASVKEPPKVWKTVKHQWIAVTSGGVVQHTKDDGSDG